MRTASHIKNVRHWESIEYKITYYKDFDFSNFQFIDLKYKTKKGKYSYNDLIIMADTETAKSINYPACLDNYVVAWSMAFRSFNRNLITLYGHSPTEFIDCLKKLRENLPGKDIYIYFHNLSYDWPFLRKWMLKEFKRPVKQLNTKPLFPLFITFECGITFKDSLSLAQCKLEKWAEDLNVEHQKAVGFWDYDKERDQNGYTFTADELKYIECDVLAGVECIDAFIHALNKNISSIPYTATGIVRNEARAAGGFKAHKEYVKMAPETYKEQARDEEVFHGGYTHANRYILGQKFKALCQDICSSYPYAVMTMKAPCTPFFDVTDEVDDDYILKDNPNYAFIFRVMVFDLDLKDLRYPMPCLSLSKCRETVNAICDNGRILRADFCEFLTNEIDYKLFVSMYKGRIYLKDVKAARKDYLPKWFTDFIYERFILKTKLNCVDAVQYMIEKGKLNAGAYGMCAQKPIKEIIEENYETGEFKPKENIDYEEEYKKHVKNPRAFLPYVWGIWCTSTAQERLFELAECIKEDAIWLYSDTDSVYATEFDEEKLKAYNQKAVDAIKARGYEPVLWKDKEYNLGVAEFDGDYSEFVTWHSKCYAKRYSDNEKNEPKKRGKLVITVAGVPKKGVATLKDNIDNFVPGLTFDGETSGKLQHKHLNVDKIYFDAHGNEIGDSVDLTPCDYVVNDVNEVNFELLTEEEIDIICYE